MHSRPILGIRNALEEVVAADFSLSNSCGFEVKAEGTVRARDTAADGHIDARKLPRHL